MSRKSDAVWHYWMLLIDKVNSIMINGSERSYPFVKDSFVQTTNKMINKSNLGISTCIYTLAIQIQKQLYNDIVVEIIDWPWKQSMNSDDNNEGKFNTDPPTQK